MLAFKLERLENHLYYLKQKLLFFGRRMARSGRRVAERVTEGDARGVQGAG